MCRWRILIVLLIVLGRALPARSSTVRVLDVESLTVYAVGGTTCSGPGTVIYTTCYGGNGGLLLADESGRWAFFDVDASELASVAFEHVYLLATEIRTESNLQGTANFYAAAMSVPIDGSAQALL